MMIWKPKAPAISVLALVAAVSSGSAWAQDRAPVVAEENDAASQSAVDGIEDIYVVARKVTENSQKVPISLQVLSKADLESRQITTAFDLQKSVSGLVVVPSSGNSGGRQTPNYAIRGQSVSALAAYFAGVLIPVQQAGRSNGMLTNLMFDMQSVQVAKGPQGTLTGRNSNGGAVYLVPQAPTDTFEGFVSTRYNDLDLWETTAALNIPIVEDRLLLRLSGIRSKGSGFTKNLSGGRDLDSTNHYMIRGYLSYKPTDWLTNDLVVTHYHEDQSPAGFVAQSLALNCGPRSTLIACLYPNVIGEVANRPNLSDQETYASPNIGYIKESDIFVSNTLTAQISPELTVKNIFGLQRLFLKELNDISGTSAPYLDVYFSQPQQYLSNELQVQGKSLGGKLEWVGGVYLDQLKYLKQDPATDIYGNAIPTGYGNHGYLYYGTPFATVLQQQIPEYVSHSQALFLHANYDLSRIAEGLSLTGGYRYTFQKIRTVVSNKINFTTCAIGSAFQGVDPVACTAPASARYDGPSWTAGIQYQISPEVMVYFSQSHGYREGGFNNGAPTAELAVFGPEAVDASEIGLKSDYRIFDIPVRTNISAHYEDYTGIQRSSIVAYTNPSGTTSLATLTQNAAAGRIYGLELEVTARPTPALELSTAYAYTNTAYKKYFALNTAGQFVDLSGLAFQNAPKHTLSVTATYTFPVPEHMGTISATLTDYYRSAIHFSADGDPESRGDGLNLADFRLDWKDIGRSGFGAALFVKNLFDESYPYNRIRFAAFGFTTQLNGPPRTIGGELNYRF